MPAGLQDLYTTLIAARRNGDLVLAAGTSGAAAIDAFLAALPGAALTLRQASIELSDQQQPSTLVVSGATGDTWWLPGMGRTTVQTQALTITYSQRGAAAVTAALAVTATIAAGQHSVSLHGSLEADGTLAFGWDPSQGSTLSLADAALVASDGDSGTGVGALVPADLPPFSSLILSSFTLSFGYQAGAATTMAFSLDADPNAIWDIIPGQHVLRNVGVTVTTAYQPLTIGFRETFSADVHATLDLGQEFEVIVWLAPDSPFWEVDIVATGGLPALQTLAQLAGAGDEVANGLRAVGLGDITLEAVRIGISRDDGSLAFVSMEGTLSFAEKVINVTAQLPVFQFAGSLSPLTPISLTALLEHMLGSPGGLPDIAVTELTLATIPQAGYYSMSVTVADGEITAGQYGISEVHLELNKTGDTVNGGLSGTILLGAAQVYLSAQYLGAPVGWSFTGELYDFDIGQLLAELASTYGIGQVPAPVRSLELTKVSVSYESGSGAFAFELEAGFTVEAAPVAVAVAIHVMPSAQAPAAGAVTTGSKGYSALFTGQVTFAGLQFDLVFDATGAGTDVLVADVVHAGPPVELQALVAGVSEQVAQAIPPGISLDVKEVKFVFLRQTATVWAFGVRLGGSISLSELPVVGSRLPPDQTLAIQDLQILYSSAELTAAQTGVINPLLPPGVSKLPSAVGKGIEFDADVQLGSVTKRLQAGVTPPAPAARPAGAASGAVVPASSADPVRWLEVNKQFGIFSFQRIGVGYQDNVLTFGLDASVAVGPLAFSMQALSVGSPLSEFAPVFSLQGLALTFDRAPLSIGGAFLKVRETVSGQAYDSYYGELIVQAASFGLKALGGWAPDTDPASFFIYLSIDVPLGGPPFLFITGLAGGFGINSQLTLPTIDQVPAFPLLPGVALPEQASPAETIKAVIPSLRESFTPRAGQYWVAAGIAFTSFEMIRAQAVVSVSFGVDLQIGVVGVCSMTLPTGDPYPIAYVEIDIVASFTPSTGLLAIDGKLAPASYLLGGFVKLTGGFAFYAWFSGPSQGDFVVSLGGYHPAFTKPSNYPAVPRLGLAFSLGPLKVIGQAYFALTPSMFMAGLRLTATFEAGPVRAWFDAGVDFLISWGPLHYEAHAWVTIGCSVDLGLFTLSVQIGADLQIWGPAFGGQALIDLDIISFTIGFGADRALPPPVGWTTFATSFLPPPETTPGTPAAGPASAPPPSGLAPRAMAAHLLTAAATVAATTDGEPGILKASITSGLTGQAADAGWILDPDQFRILTSSTIPANHARWATSAANTAELPETVSSYQQARSPQIAAPAAQAHAAVPPPAGMLLQLDSGTATYSGAQVWAPDLNIAPMAQAGVASYHTVTLLKRDETGHYTSYITGIAVAPQLGASSTALWGTPGQATDPNADRLIPATLTGLAISPVPRTPAQVRDVPLISLIYGQGSTTTFGYQAPAADPQYTVSSQTSPDGRTLTLTVGGAHAATITNQQYLLTALTDPWVTSQRTATLNQLTQLGFTTTPGNAIRLDQMAQTPLTDWPATARIGTETYA